jgi:hypothetical protein
MTARIATDACHLYRVVDAVRGKFYLGKHRGRIQQGYWGSGKRISRHIKKYGKQDLRYEILVIADEDYIYDLEKRWITPEYLDANPDCLNLCPGGMGGNLGQVPHNKGKKASEETRMKQRMAKLGKPGVRTGTKQSPEAIAKMVAAKRGYIASAEARAKISLANAGRKHALVTCQHCGTMGGITAMPRWHFKNCKHKES